MNTFFIVAAIHDSQMLMTASLLDVDMTVQCVLYITQFAVIKKNSDYGQDFRFYLKTKRKAVDETLEQCFLFFIDGHMQNIR